MRVPPVDQLYQHLLERLRAGLPVAVRARLDRRVGAVRVVLDTSVLMSGDRHALWLLARTGYIQAYWSTWIVAELIRVRMRRAYEHGQAYADFRARANAFVDVLSQVLHVADYQQVRLSRVLRDEDDDPVLATALACGARSIIRFNVEDYGGGAPVRGVRALKPADFVRELEQLYPNDAVPLLTTNPPRVVP